MDFWHLPEIEEMSQERIKQLEDCIVQLRKQNVHDRKQWKHDTRNAAKMKRCIIYYASQTNGERATELLQKITF